MAKDLKIKKPRLFWDVPVQDAGMLPKNMAERQDAQNAG